MEAADVIGHERVVVRCGVSQVGLEEVQRARGGRQSERRGQSSDQLGQAVDVEADDGESVPLAVANQPIVVLGPQAESLVDRKSVPTVERLRYGQRVTEDAHQLETG